MFVNGALEFFLTEPYRRSPSSRSWHFHNSTLTTLKIEFTKNKQKGDAPAAVLKLNGEAT